MDIYERLKARAGGSEADEDSLLSNEHGDRLTDSSESPFVIIQRGSKRSQQARNRRNLSEANADHGLSIRGQETEFRRACFEERVETKDGSKTKRPSKANVSSSANNLHRDSQIDLETRANVFDSVLGTVDRTIKEQMQIADESVFQEIYSFSERTMKKRTKEVDSLLPTGLVIGGGVSSADYSRVFPAMKIYLEEHGCRVALLAPNDFNGKTLSYTLEKILLQASRESETDVLASGFCSMDDIVGWHANHMLGSSCPLIIIVESVEMSQAQMLQDLIHVLHAHNQAIPQLLLLGLTTTRATLMDAVPHSMVDRCLRCQNFEMAEAINQFEEIVKQLLVKTWSGCLITVKDFHGLMGLFIKHNLTVNGISRCIKMLFADFIAKHPCPSLISASFGDAHELKLHLETLSPGMLQQLVEFICLHGNMGESVNQRIRKGDKASHVEWIFRQYCDFRRSWEIWRLALLLMAHIGQSVMPSIDFSCYQIYDWRDAESLQQQVDSISHEVSLFPDSLVQELHEKVENIFEASSQEWVPNRALEALDRLKMQVQHHHCKEPWHPKTKTRAQKGVSHDSRIDIEASCMESDVGSAQGSEMGRSRYHGRMSRRAALLSQSKKITVAVPCGDENEVHASLGSAWCQIFCPFVLEELKRSPFDLPGAALFCCDLDKVTHHLVASTRGCTYSALTNPKLFYEDSCPRDMRDDSDDKLGVDASDEDTCIAFSLLNDDPTCSNLVEWYVAFEDVVSNDRVPNSRIRKLRGSKGEDCNRTEKIGRFSQSLQDLQFIGMIQSSRKRKGDHVQRCVYQPFTM